MFPRPIGALTQFWCGAESCVDFADFARDREALFRDFLELPGGLPSHDTFSRLFGLLDPVAFAACLAQFLAEGGERRRGRAPVAPRASRNARSIVAALIVNNPASTSGAS